MNKFMGIDTTYDKRPRINNTVVVGFTGTQCTGKTEQAILLRELEDFKIYTSPGRSLYYENGIDINEDGTLGGQIQITGKMEEYTASALRQKAHSISSDNRYNSFKAVFERTHVDVRAYTLTSKLSEEEAFNMSGVNQALAIRQYEELFDIVFYFKPAPVEWYMSSEDGTRSTDITYRYKVDELIRAELFDTGYYDTSKIVTVSFTHPYKVFATIAGAIEKLLYPSASEAYGSLVPTRATDDDNNPDESGGST